MAQVAHKLPSVIEELDRKTFETLNWLIGGIDGGRLTEQQFSTGLDALFMAVAGLVNEEFLDLLTAAQGMCGNGANKVRRLFHHPDEAEIVKFTWTVGGSVIATFKLVNGQVVSGKSRDFDDAKTAARMFKKCGESLVQRGWIEL